MKQLFPRSLVTRLAVWLLLAVPLLAGCSTDSASVKAAREHEEEFKKVDDALIQANFARHGITSSNYQRTESGIYIVTLEQGTGTQIVAGKKVQVKYIGKFVREEREDEVFDKSRQI